MDILNKLHTLFIVVTKTKNWRTVLKVRFGKIDSEFVKIYFRNGTIINVRPKTGDIHEAIGVCSGREYPFKHTFEPLKTANVPLTILDIGGHIGTFSITAKKQLPNAKVFSYEPVPQNAELFLKNVSENNIKNAKLTQSAVTGTSKKVKMKVDSTFLDGGSISKDGNVKVDSININEVTKNLKKIDLLKLDVEGSEWEILSNMKDLNKVERIAVETHDFIEQGLREKVKEHLINNGFEMVYYRNNNKFDLCLMVFAKIS